MLSPTGSLILWVLLVGLGIAAVWLSTAILRRGKLYHRLKPEARPRRWVLISVLVLFVVFLVWFPVWMAWPETLISRLLTIIFAGSFLLIGVALKWFAPLVDAFIRRKRWPLR